MVRQASLASSSPLGRLTLPRTSAALSTTAKCVISRGQRWPRRGLGKAQPRHYAQPRSRLAYILLSPQSRRGVRTVGGGYTSRAPNKGLQTTVNSVRSCLALAVHRV